MKIVVIGGTGLIGSKLVKKLRAGGHDALAASPNTGVDIITGQGLAEALADAQVVVDVANAPNWGDAAVMNFFQTSARNISAAEAAAGVGHHVALSVVGTDRLQDSGYFRAKLAQERAVKAAAVPWTILRATQFFEFIAGIADSGTKDGTVFLPPILFQPEAAEDVAATLAGIAAGAPVNGTVELAGPERFRLDELVRRYLSAKGDPRPVTTDARAPYYGLQVHDERTLIPGGDCRVGAITFAEWLSGSTAPPNSPHTKEGMHMPVTTAYEPVVLEPASQAFVEATAKPPFTYQLTPAEARKGLDDVQAAPIAKLPVTDEWVTVPAEVGDVRVRIVRPPDADGTLPVILYMHGGGWVLGNAGTHDRLVRELAVGTGAAVAFVEYDRSPEAHFPVAIEQGYATARWIVREGAAHRLDPQHMAVAGDSVGGGMTAALTLMAADRGDVRFIHQSMYYPVTDAAMDTGSYQRFAEGYFLSAKSMEWFWNAYLPDVTRRAESYASPLRASDAQLTGLPPAFVIVDEADVLRDEGEAYAARLRANGVPVTTVRYDGITHDFMMLNPLSGTHATRAAVAQAVAILSDALYGA
jgi:acetyl esterase/lipase/uncharacterized protein YbjT (DUF2867 family)